MTAALGHLARWTALVAEGMCGAATTGQAWTWTPPTPAAGPPSPGPGGGSPSP